MLPGSPTACPASVVKTSPYAVREGDGGRAVTMPSPAEAVRASGASTPHRYAARQRTTPADGLSTATTIDQSRYWNLRDLFDG